MQTDEIILDVDYQKSAIDEWIAILTRMWDAIGKEDARRLEVYAREFKDIPLGLLDAAVSRVIRNNGDYLTVPSISALWAAIKKEAGDFPNMDIMDAVAVWEDRTFERGVYRFGQ